MASALRLCSLRLFVCVRPVPSPLCPSAHRFLHAEVMRRQHPGSGAWELVPQGCLDAFCKADKFPLGRPTCMPCAMWGPGHSCLANSGSAPVALRCGSGQHTGGQRSRGCPSTVLLPGTLCVPLSLFPLLEPHHPQMIHPSWISGDQAGCPQQLADASGPAAVHAQTPTQGSRTGSVLGREMQAQCWGELERGQGHLGCAGLPEVL